LKTTIQKYLEEILGDSEFLGISFFFRYRSNTIIEIEIGTPTFDTAVLIDALFGQKENQSFKRNSLTYIHKFFSLKEDADCILSLVHDENNSVSPMTIKHISNHIELIIKEYYIKKQNATLEGDIYKLWDILDGSMKHYVNNEIFSILGRLDVVKASKNFDVVDDIKIGLKDLILNVDKIFLQKGSVISSKGIIKSKNYYKNNNIIDID